MFYCPYIDQQENYSSDALKNIMNKHENSKNCSSSQSVAAQEERNRTHKRGNENKNGKFKLNMSIIILNMNRLNKLIERQMDEPGMQICGRVVA
jgi:hypothetical protein